MGGAWAVAGKIAAAIAGFAYSTTTARLLGPESFGALVLATSLVLGASLISNLGLASITLRAVARAGVADSRHALDRTLVRVGMVAGSGALLVATIVAAALPATARFWPVMAPLAEAWPWIAAWIVLHAIQRLGSEALRGLKNIGAATFLAGTVTNAIATVALWLVLRTGSDPVVLDDVWRALIVALVANALILGGVLARERAALSGGGAEDSGREPSKPLLTGALPLFWLSVTTFLLTNGDVWILGATAAADQLGAYGAAQRIMVLVSTPLLMVQAVVPAYLAGFHHQGRRADLELLMRGAAGLAAVPTLAVLAATTLGASGAMAWLFGADYAPGGIFLTVLSLGLVLPMLSSLAATTLVMSGYERALSRSWLVIGTATILAALLVAPTFGAIGVAIAMATGRNALALAEVRLVRVHLGLSGWADLRPRRMLAALRMSDAARG